MACDLRMGVAHPFNLPVWCALRRSDATKAMLAERLERCSTKRYTQLEARHAARQNQESSSVSGQAAGDGWKDRMCSCTMNPIKISRSPYRQRRHKCVKPTAPRQPIPIRTTEPWCHRSGKPNGPEFVEAVLADRAASAVAVLGGEHAVGVGGQLHRPHAARNESMEWFRIQT